MGLVDLIRGWPQPDTAHVGLLLIREDQQRRGLGRATVGAVEGLLGGRSEIDRLRATVVESNLEVLEFWWAAGFRDSGERRVASVGAGSLEAWVIVKDCRAGRREAGDAP